MKKNLLLAGLLTTFSLVAKSQVGINTTNPQGVFNIDGSKNNPASGVPTAVQAADDLVVTSNGNLGLGLIAPGTTLDVNGAITNRETALTVAGNAVTIPANVSLVQLTGAATSTVVVTAPAAPNPGQRLIIYNNTTGGFGASLGGVTIPNGKALEYVYSNSGWRATDGGAVGGSSGNIYTTDGTLAGNRTVTQGANTLTFTGTQTNAFSVDGSTLSVDAANDRVGLGTTTPDTKLTISTPDNNYGVNHTNGTISLKTFIGGGVAYLGTATPNDLHMMTNGTAKMTVTSAGDVGVGTATPDTKLTISTPDNNYGVNHTNGTISLKTYIGGGAAFLGTTTPNNLYLMTNSTTKMTITPAGNVGVGTSAPDNSALLDVSATNKGFLLPRVSLTSITDGATVPSPAKGLIVYNSNTALTPYGEGVYTNSGTPAAPKWDKLAPQTTDYLLLGVFNTSATFPVDQNFVGPGNIIDNINLGMSTSVTIPANSTAKIVVDYSVPAGTTVAYNGTVPIRGFYGVRFLRNGTEAPEGSRKYTIPEGTTSSQMASISGKFNETYNNTSASPVTITYTLNGYVENTTYPVRFNMWASSGANFNWGKSSMAATVFTKEN